MCWASWRLASVVAEFVSEGSDGALVLVARFPDLDIGADGEGVEWDGAFLRPLGEGLGKEIQAGDEIVEVDLVNGRGLVVEGAFRVVAPVVGGGEDAFEGLMNCRDVRRPGGEGKQYPWVTHECSA